MNKPPRRTAVETPAPGDEAVTVPLEVRLLVHVAALRIVERRQNEGITALTARVEALERACNHA